MKSALITGILGQDGSLLAEYLLSMGYRVVGTVRKNPATVPWATSLIDRAEFVYADMRDAMSIEAAVNKAWPDEAYNFAGYDGIPLCWSHPEQAMDVIYGGLSRLLNVLKRVKADTRVYQASSAAMFGDASGMLDESTPMRPNSPYAIAKHAAHELASMHRDMGMFVSCGICLNHESPRRCTDRASSKIARAVAGWAMGGEDPMQFGGQEAKRDWGYAGDFVKAFHLMLQQDAPSDYVIGTGEAHSVREFIRACCTAAGLGAVPDHLIRTDGRLVRQNDIRVMVANPAKAERELGWRYETDYARLAEIMVAAEVERMTRRTHANTPRLVPA